jgi:hypothetical protein
VRTTKISIAVDKKKLRMARAAAKAAGLSLSAFLSRGLDLQLEAHDRLQAARELAASWGVDSVPTVDERAAFRRAMSRPRRHRSRAA